MNWQRRPAGLLPQMIGLKILKYVKDSCKFQTSIWNKILDLLRVNCRTARRSRVLRAATGRMPASLPPCARKMLRSVFNSRSVEAFPRLLILMQCTLASCECTLHRLMQNLTRRWRCKKLLTDFNMNCFPALIMSASFGLGQFREINTSKIVLRRYRAAETAEAMTSRGRPHGGRLKARIAHQHFIFSDRIRFCLYYSTLPHPTQQNFYFVAFTHVTNISPYPLRRTICPISATNPRRNKIHVLLAMAGKTCVWALPRPIPDRHPLLLHHTTQRGRCQALPRLFRYFCAKSASAIA